MKRTEYPFITINILSWNRQQELAIILNKLREAYYPKNKLEVMVVDNASTDGAPEMVERNFPEVKLIRRPYNNGIGGWNDGFRMARGEYIIVLDDDAYPEPDAYYKIVDFFEKKPDTGIINLGVVKGFDGTELVLKEWDMDLSIGFWGGASVIKKEVIKKAGLYDEQFFIGVHEADYALRVLNEGFTIKYVPEIKVFHKGAGAYHQDFRYIYYTTRNKFWISWKYFPLYAILISNIIWLVHSFLLSLKLGGINNGFWPGIKDALLGLGHIRRWPRKTVKPVLIKRILRRFSLSLIIKGIKLIFYPTGN